MPGNILLVAATTDEAGAFRKISVPGKSAGSFFIGDCNVSILVTGVGIMATSWKMSKYLATNAKPDLAINAGIAGSYRDELKPGSVVMPVSDCFADSGIETGEGFMTLFEAGLDDPYKFPYKNGQLVTGNRFILKTAGRVTPVKSITVNTASGNETTIERLRKKYDPDIETMEGAAFFYICLETHTPFMALRAVSNKVELRNKKKWDIPLALNNLSGILEEFLLTFH